MRIIGFDLSTKSSGVAIYDNAELIHYECVTAASSDLFARIQKITDRIQQILDQYKPDYAALEDPLPAVVGNNIATYKALTYLQGYICMMLRKKKIKYDLLVSSHWRSKAGLKVGKGIKRQALKKQAIDKVTELYNIKVNDDVAEAILIAYSKIKTDKNIAEFDWS